MRQKPWRISSRVSREKLWLCAVLFLLAACATGGPSVTVCVSDPQANGLDCYNEVTKKNSFIPYEKSDHYVAFSQEDAKSLMTYCLGK